MLCFIVYMMGFLLSHLLDSVLLMKSHNLSFLSGNKKIENVAPKVYLAKAVLCICIWFAGHTTSEMDTMLSKQNKLISKLKAECKRQAAQIEAILKKNRLVLLKGNSSSLWATT